MSLLDDLPHLCTIRKKIRTKSEFGGMVETTRDVAVDVPCWEQPAGSAAITRFAKRGISVSRVIYFNANPNVKSDYEILVTYKEGVEICSPVALDVKHYSDPDASVGLGLLFAVYVDWEPGELE